jgi:hypothetical protein
MTTLNEADAQQQVYARVRALSDRALGLIMDADARGEKLTDDLVAVSVSAGQSPVVARQQADRFLATVRVVFRERGLSGDPDVSPSDVTAFYGQGEGESR